MEEKLHSDNPFFSVYDTPHHTVPFDKIKFCHYEEAFMEGMRREDEFYDKVINNPEEPTFENTIIPYDESKGKEYYDLLDKVSEVFSCMMSAETSDEMEDLAEKLTPLLTKHGNDISLNPRLFARVKHVYEHHRELTSEEQMLLDDCYDGFVNSGALLDEAGKAKLRALTEEGGMLTLQFAQNLLKERKAFQMLLTDEADLDGLPQTARDAAKALAEEEGKEGYLFTLDSPSYSPFMTYSTRRPLRERMYMASNTLCIKDNNENNLDICTRLVNMRRELAQLLGYKTFADYRMRHRMAGSAENVYKLMNQLIDAYMPTARAEYADVVAKAKEMEGQDFDFKPWDFSYYSHKIQMERYNIDSEMLRPYLKIDNVISGVFGLATRLYGITFKENKQIPVYHPDVKAFEVFDRDGKYLAVFYADFYPRKGKQGGAWMTEFQGQWIDRHGENVRPHVSVVMNFTKPTPDHPALLTLGELSTFLHEFGHSLHGMFANTRFEALSGTNVWWDFVELPSQFMENYSTEREFLHTFATHYETGEPIPDELIDRVVASQTYLSAYSCMRQVSFALLDMAYYTLDEPFAESIPEFERKAWQKAQVSQGIAGTCMTPQFSHIMDGGYSAGYYSYKWAEVLDADAFAVFKREGVFNQATAQRFRDCILSRGGTEHPMTLYKRFRGGEPTIDALMERDGIKKQQA